MPSKISFQLPRSLNSLQLITSTPQMLVILWLVIIVGVFGVGMRTEHAEGQLEKMLWLQIGSVLLLFLILLLSRWQKIILIWPLASWSAFIWLGVIVAAAWQSPDFASSWWGIHGRPWEGVLASMAFVSFFLSTLWIGSWVLQPLFRLSKGHADAPSAWLLALNRNNVWIRRGGMLVVTTLIFYSLIFLTNENGDSDSSNFSQSWEYTSLTLQKKPLWGAGPAQFTFAFEQEVRPAFSPEEQAALNAGENWRQSTLATSNEAFTLWSSTGYLGLLSFVAISFLTLRSVPWSALVSNLLLNPKTSSLKEHKKSPSYEGLEQPLSLLFFAELLLWLLLLWLGCWLLLILQDGSVQLWLSWWASLAGVLAICQITRNNEIKANFLPTKLIPSAVKNRICSKRGMVEKMGKWTPVILCFIWAIGVSWISGQWYRAEQQAQRGDQLRQEIETLTLAGGDYESLQPLHQQAYEALLTAHNLAPWHSGYQARLARQMLDYGALETQQFSLQFDQDEQTLSELEDWFRTAENEIVEAINTSPQVAEYYRLYGELLVDVEQTIAAYEQAIERQPYHPSAYFFLAREYYNNGELDTAVLVLEDALLVKPDWIPIWLQLIEVQIEGNLLREAQTEIQSFQAWIREDPSSRAEYNGGDLRDALADLNQEVERALERGDGEER